MTKYISPVITLSVFCISLAGCFKEEPLNAECDIEQAWIHYDDPESSVWQLSDTIKNEISSTSDSIGFDVYPGTDRRALAPTFVITPGATISPANGSVQDFTQGPVLYTVTSEDGQWQRIYKVDVREKHHTVSTTISYGFENYSLYQVPGSSAKYYVWEAGEGEEASINQWATGNGGFKISNMMAKPDEYPTVPLEEGRTGRGVQLTTRATGPIAQAVGKRLAAGNLFLGSFNSQIALTESMKATHFGIPFDKKPLRFSGYYRYQPGETFWDTDGTPMPDRVDEPAIYAIFYKNHDNEGNSITLYGDNIQTSPQIVAKAVMTGMGKQDEWTRFEVEFNYIENLDLNLLSTFGYSLAVVFSSSTDGALFRGAVGSTLCIDDVQIICEKEETKEDNNIE